MEHVLNRQYFLPLHVLFFSLTLSCRASANSIIYYLVFIYSLTYPFSRLFHIFFVLSYVVLKLHYGYSFMHSGNHSCINDVLYTFTYTLLHVFVLYVAHLKQRMAFLRSHEDEYHTWNSILVPQIWSYQTFFFFAQRQWFPNCFGSRLPYCMKMFLTGSQVRK